MNEMIDSSNSSPAIWLASLATIPPIEMTAHSVVPPPMSTTMFPAGSWIGSPDPMAAAIGSSMTMTGLRAPANSAASWTARRSTPVIPDGMQITMRGFAHRFRWWTRWMK